MPVWRRAIGGMRDRAARLLEAGVKRGLPASLGGYRWVRHETVPEYFERHRHSPSAGRYETVHPEARARHALPCNVASRDALPGVEGWWGFSFRDVPSRLGGETFVATIPDARVAWYRDAARGGSFFPAVLAGDGTALDLRELRFRPGHAAVLRASAAPARVPRATWVTERVYDNHSHWLTAHLPKIVLLARRGELEDVLLPTRRTPAMDASLRLVGLDAAAFRTFDAAGPLRVRELTLVGTDRFRPELLRLVQEASGVLDAPPGGRRLFISRERAARRRLDNEAELWPLLSSAGFERVHLEDLPFAEQAALMREASVVCGLHGAGLANVLFCPPGTHVVEIADPGFPNPNFYAMAAALGHRYWLVEGEPTQAGGAAVFGEPGWSDLPETARPGWRDLRVDVRAVEDVLRRLEAFAPAAGTGERRA